MAGLFLDLEDAILLRLQALVQQGIVQRQRGSISNAPKELQLLLAERFEGAGGKDQRTIVLKTGSQRDSSRHPAISHPGISRQLGIIAR